MARRRKRLKKKVRKTFLLLLLLTIIIVVLININPFNNDLKEKYKTKRLKQDLSVKYNYCMSKQYNEENYDDDLINKIDELNNYFKDYNVFISYSELDEDFYYGYKDDQAMYGASLIKLVDALYLVDNDVDLNQTIKLSSNFYSVASPELKAYKVGSDVPIEDVVKYALSVSDNGAHQMLIKYIGFDKLKEYGRSLGAKHTLEGWDNFGNQSAYDTNIYLRRMYELSNHKESAKRMLEYMNNQTAGYLNINGLEVSHKYGYYNEVFHDIGIVYDSHPYAVSVLTTYGRKDYSDKVNMMSTKVYELHSQYWESKDNYCHNLVYNKKTSE